MSYKTVNLFVKPDKIAVILATSLLLFILSLPAWTQGNLGRIVGAVTDQNGGAIANANVTVRDVQRGVSRTLVTDSGGEYSAPSLIPGQYEVIVEAAGFARFDRQNITVEVGQEVRVDVSLNVGSADPDRYGH